MGSVSTPVASFDGSSSQSNNDVFGTTWAPADPSGAIGLDTITGKKYYMQWVNSVIQIWDVTNLGNIQRVLGPSRGSSIWSGFGGRCENDFGDPIVLYDHLANRWFASQFAWSDTINGSVDYGQCVAISQTGDPTGAWYRYDFDWDYNLMNDYPKFGVWPDGYYMSVNQFGPSNGWCGVGQGYWCGPGVAVMERSKMLQGLEARMIKFAFGSESQQDIFAHSSLLPSDLDGPAPKAGTPNTFIEFEDWGYYGTGDYLYTYEFKANWKDPRKSMFGKKGFQPSQILRTAVLDAAAYNNGGIEQPHSAVLLDNLGDRLMYRAAYRVINGTPTLVGNVSVATGAGKVAVHWFELRLQRGSWQIYQESTYAPDSENRWMGSIATDKDGNMALGYSVSSSTTDPSVRYTGRLATDPVGTMRDEASLVEGSGSQTTSYRWGDYSAMTVDPADDCTFWYTQEYYKVTGDFNWTTRIGAFRHPSCVPPTRVMIRGHVLDAMSQPLAGATVSWTEDKIAKTTVTDSNGAYGIAVPQGWSGTMKIALAPYKFTPLSRKFSTVLTDVTSADFIWR